MKTILSVIIKFLAFIIAGLLVVTLPLSLIIYNTGQALFNPQVVARVSRAVFVDSELIPGALEFVTNQRAEEISQEIEEQDEDNEFNLFYLIEGMEVEDWRNIRKELLTDEILDEWIHTTVSAYFAWLDSEDQTPEIRWDMKPLIERMRGSPGEKIVTTFYNSLPDCTDLQMEEMKTGEGEPLPKRKMVENLCKLSTFPHQEQIRVYDEILHLAVERIPPVYNFTQALVKEDSALQTPLAAKKQLREWRKIAELSLLLPLLLLFLILAFGVRSLTDLGQWWGIPLAGGSLIAFITSLLFKPLWTGLLSERMPGAVPSTSVLYHELISNSGRAVSEVFNPLRWQSFLLLLIGLGFMVMGFVLKWGSGGKREG